MNPLQAKTCPSAALIEIQEAKLALMLNHYSFGKNMGVFFFHS